MSRAGKAVQKIKNQISQPKQFKERPREGNNEPPKSGTSPTARAGRGVLPAVAAAPRRPLRVHCEDDGRKGRGEGVHLGREKSPWPRPWPSRRWRRVAVSRVLRVSAFRASSAGQGTGRLFAKVPNPRMHRGRDSLAPVKQICVYPR